MNKVEQFIKYACEFVPDYRERIRGASLAEIETFEQLVGVPFPQIYKDYLLRLGYDNGGLEIVGDYSDITVLIEYYEEFMLPYGEVSDDTIVIGEDMIVGSFVLHCIPSKEPAVFNGEPNNLGSLYSESFEKLLFRSVFTVCQHRRFPYVVSLMNDDYRPLLKPLAEVVIILGYTPLWFSDSVAFCAEKPESTIYAIQAEGGRGITISVATALAGLLMDQILSIIINKLELDEKTLIKNIDKCKNYR
ncbi:MAG: SMI1/KNR4 family protein [Candidatus Parabeggiatoa sp.]|nr:SMI1/KNR4 family protein [Candidatus Parabeggiatoa sp.]